MKRIIMKLLLSPLTVAPSTEVRPNAGIGSYDGVILLHGLARSSRSFSHMEAALKASGYHVHNIDYPSRKHTVETLADEFIPKAISACKVNNTQRIHFVTHSMGGIVLRYYLSRNSLAELGRVVMLSPPNQGSEVVDKLKNFPGFYALNGPAGRQLGTDENSLPHRLGAADYALGIITGNRSINPLLSLLIPGANDGKVSLERAKLAGMSDFLVVPHSHPLIMRSNEVIRQTQFFLQHGVFEHLAPSSSAR